jgi:hypothetical protein
MLRLVTAASLNLLFQMLRDIARKLAANGPLDDLLKLRELLGR